MDHEVQSIMDSFRRIVQALRKSTKNSEGQFGLRTAQFFVLQQLRKFEPLSTNELAVRTFSHQSTVSVVVEGLVEMGLAHKSIAPEDRRRTVLTVTSEGQELIKKHHLTIQEKFAEGLMKMSKQDRSRLADLLESFTAHAGLSETTPHFFFEKENKPASKNKRKKQSSK